MKKIVKRTASIFVAVTLFLGTSPTMGESEKKLPLNIGIPHGNVLDPRTYYVGAVQREYVTDPSKEGAATISLGQYLSDSTKTIESVTGELKWNFGDGIATVDTPRAQGVTGFLNKRKKIDFQDISFFSDNEYGTIIAISLDDKPLSESRRILVQTMTQDQLYGYSEQRVYTSTGEYKGKNEITNLGRPPWNIKNIEASFILKNASDIARISVLDENGYFREELPWESLADGAVRVNLRENSIYTIIELGDTTMELSSGQDKKIEYIWWEGEDYHETNFPKETEFSETTFPEDKKDVLSAGKWLTLSGKLDEGEEIPYVKYRINIKEDGQYSFFMRRFWRHGPLQYRIDDGEWVKMTNFTLMDTVEIRKNLVVNWVPAGVVDLTKGSHIIEIQQIDSEGNQLEIGAQLVACYDAFILVNGPFVPLDLKRPDEKLTAAQKGFFAFAPDTDAYGESPIDLRYLNEEEAGQDGYMYAEGDKLYLANGEEVKLWGTNIGGELVSSDNATIDNFTRKMAKYGINLVRMHKGFLQYNLDITDTMIERIQYFINSCKKNGIYVKFSFYFPLENQLHQVDEFAHKGRFTEDGLSDGFLQSTRNGYAYIIWNENLQNAYLKGLERLLTAENPHGKTPLAYEPAIAIIEVQNEDSFFFGTAGAWRWPHADQKRFAKIFGDWLIEKYGSINKAVKHWGDVEPERPRTYQYDDFANGYVAWQDTGDFVYQRDVVSNLNNRKLDFRTFLIELQRGFYAKMADKFREMGYQGMTIGSNWHTIDNQLLDAVERYTYTAASINDRHGYNNNASALENAPGDSSMGYAVVRGQRYIDTSVLLEPERCPIKAVHTLGQPTTITETTWTNPSKYKAEGPFIETAYSSLQGIDGIVTAGASPDWSMTIMKYPQNNPSLMGQFPAFALMYRRGDVKEAQVVAYESITVESLYTNKPSRIFNGINIDDYRRNQ